MTVSEAAAGATYISIRDKALFPDFSKLSRGDRHKAITSLIAHFRTHIWPIMNIIPHDEPRNKRIKDAMPLTLSTVMLSTLIRDPSAVFSDEETALLKKMTYLDRRVQFCLKTPGCIIVVVVGLAAGLASAISYHFGLFPPEEDPKVMSLSVGVSIVALTALSAYLGWYITGDLPKCHSEQANKEQNMWESFLDLKAKPAAYDLLRWHSPLTNPLESADSRTSRRQFAMYVATHLKMDTIKATWYAMATQTGKIDTTLSYLEEAVCIVLKQHERETDPETALPPETILLADLNDLAKHLGYV